MAQNVEQTRRARLLRRSQTNAEGLLWSRLRSRQLCKLKFRRQHPIGPFFADFACESQMLVVELDGDYHDNTQKEDLKRQEFLVANGWRVFRFTNEEVLNDAEIVLRAIANHAGKPFSFEPRSVKGSGRMSERGSVRAKTDRRPK